MSDHVTLTWRGGHATPIDVEGVTPDRCAVLSEQEIAALPVRVGTRLATVGDCFSVQGGRVPVLRVVGGAGHVHGLGAGMRSGELAIEGDAGDRVGAGMTGGVIVVAGCIGDAGGQAMAGGVLRVQGDAGHGLGAALPGASRGMTGGEIVVSGRVGDHAGARARRGLVAVGGDAGAFTGRAMIAGTVLVAGRVGARPVEGNKRGTLVALGEVPVPVTYSYACTYEPPFVRLLLTHLRRRHGFDVAAAALDGRYRRFCGDAGTPGKGEILALTR